jgi:hypothetical protein
MYHTTKDGRKIKISEMTTDHLINQIKFIEKKAKEGITTRCGGGSCAEDFWMDEEVYTGKEVKKFFNYKAYKAELKKRQ